VRFTPGRLCGADGPVTRRAGMLWALVLAVVVAAADARAQSSDPPQAAESRQVGLSVGYPATGLSSAAFGLIWQTSDQLAFRPELSVSARFTGEAVGVVSGDAWSLGTTLTVLCYVARREGVAAYVGPRFSYSWSSSSADGTGNTSAGYGLGVNAGLQYRLTRRINLYGEAGLGYMYTTSTYTSETFGQSNTTHSINTRSSIGLNLFF
jgi:opacity protein-like surface antigen